VNHLNFVFFFSFEVFFPSFKPFFIKKIRYFYFPFNETQSFYFVFLLVHFISNLIIAVLFCKNNIGKSWNSVWNYKDRILKNNKNTSHKKNIIYSGLCFFIFLYFFSLNFFLFSIYSLHIKLIWCFVLVSFIHVITMLIISFDFEFILNLIK